MLIVKDDKSYSKFLDLLNEGHKIHAFNKTPSTAMRALIELKTGGMQTALLFKKYYDQFSSKKEEIKSPTIDNSLIFGKDLTERIVGLEVKASKIKLWKEAKDGALTEEERQNNYWILASQNHQNKFTKLKGDLHYKFIKTYDSYPKFRDALQFARSQQLDVYTVWDKNEAAMIYNGITLFKNTKINEVSCLSFDIETMGLVYNKDSKVLLISNTYRKNGSIVRKLFVYDDYETPADMFDAWSDWVQEMNPAIILGHNIYGYDFPYLKHCAEMAGTTLRLGRDNADITFDKKESQFRKDGSQSYSYFKARVYGRQVIDTMFLAIKYDVARKYVSYGLKQIIKQEELEVKDRQFYDAGTIRDNYKDPVEWKKIKTYAEHDADDALALFDLMAPSYFYLTQSIPKSFESVNNSATGSQINAFLVRSYLQDGYSIPKKSDQIKYEGAISFGVPGNYVNILKVDVNSLYPSIMRQYKVYDKIKDPKGHFLKMVEYFTDERLNNKKRATETKDRYYKDLEQSQKIVANSCYGLLGAAGLNFNSAHNAAFVTEKGREILIKSIEWATGEDYASWKKANNLEEPKEELTDSPADEEQL